MTEQPTDGYSIALERIEREHKERTGSLDLGRLGLPELPKELLELKHLEALNLGSIFTGLDGKMHLAESNLGENFLRGLESVPRDLSRLRTLGLSRARVVEWAVLAQFRRLSYLTVGGTNLIDLTPIGELESLVTLNLWETLVVDLSPLANLESLQVLNCKRAEVADLSPLGQLGSLQSLNCSYTLVKDLSPLADLLELNQVKLNHTNVRSLAPLRRAIEGGLGVTAEAGVGAAIDIQGCPLIEPPIDVVNEGREAILRYFESLDASRTEALADYVNREARLLVIGNSTAGKTHLIHFLRGSKKQRAEIRGENDISSTHGMEVHRWKLSKAVSRSLGVPNGEISILDFGGQEYYHDCHPIFFHGRTAYIVVWEKQTNTHGRLTTTVRYQDGEERQVELEHHPLSYWLEAIAHFVRTRSNRDWYLDALVEAQLNEGRMSDAPKAPESSLASQSLNPSMPISETSFLDLRHALLAHPRLSGLDPQPRESAVDEIVYRAKCELYTGVSAIAVQNKVDLDGRVHLDMAELTREYPFLIDSISVSVKEEIRTAQLERGLLPEALEHLQIVGETYPGHYRAVFDWAAKCQEFGVSLEDAREAFQRSLPATLDYDEGSFQDFLLHGTRLGKLLYFRTSPGLADRVFPKPYELLSRIHAILNRGLEDRGGSFDLGDAKAALEKGGFAAKEAEDVLGLMKAFRIVFPVALSGTPEPVFIAPQYLAHEPHRSIRFLRGMFNKPIVRFQYAGFIHASIALHFYSRFGARADSRGDDPEAAENFLFWRDGICVREGEEVVLVEFDRDQFCINLYPQRAHKMIPLVEEIAKGLEEISAGYSFTKQVSADGEIFVPLAELESRAERGVHWFEFEGHPLQLGKFSQFLPNRKFPMKKLFISYSSRDRAFLEELRAHLRILERNNLISTWHDRQLAPGMEWDRTIKKELAEADVILLLLSPDFLNSDYIWDVELEQALEMHEQKKAKIVPILLRSCMWQDTPLSRIQNANVVPKKGQPIDLAPNRDQAWNAVVKGIKEAIGPGK